MTKDEFILRQLSRTKRKKYEQYVVTKIIHLIDNHDVKFITQQYVTRPSGRALTDLYFPQLGLHVEVDEAHHLSNKEADSMREADIVEATGHKFLRVDAALSLEAIDKQIVEIVNEIKSQLTRKNIEPWDLEYEMSTEKYLGLGYVDADEDVAFKTIKDACNCFGHKYKGYQKAVAVFPEENTILWFPKAYPNSGWNNAISDDHEVITERSVDEDIAREHIEKHINPKFGKETRRVVFARVKGSLGDVLYRFRGVYELNLKKSNQDVGLIWERTAKRVSTIK